MGKLLQRMAAALTGLALAGSVGLAAELPASAATACQTTFSSYQTVRKGSKGAQAKAVECLLAKAGYRTTVNSSISVAEASQIAKFRQAVGLDGTKAVGPRGWVALIAHGSAPYLKAGNKNASVLRVQLALRAGGYLKVPATGKLDPATVKILKKAQKDHKVTATGTVNAKTWKLLQSGKLIVAAKKTPTPAAPTGKGAKALAYAKKQLGDTYKYGASGPDKWDCSGLTMMAWKSAGVSLPHSAKAQYKKGTKVAKADLKVGDLVFFYSGPSHVGIYAGDGKIIHASRPGKPVAAIKISAMPYKGARRP